MTAACTVPLEAPPQTEEAAPPLRSEALPLFVLAAILLGPLLWVASVLFVACDLGAEVGDDR